MDQMVIGVARAVVERPVEPARAAAVRAAAVRAAAVKALAVRDWAAKTARVRGVAATVATMAVETADMMAGIIAVVMAPDQKDSVEAVGWVLVMAVLMVVVLRTTVPMVGVVAVPTEMACPRTHVPGSDRQTRCSARPCCLAQSGPP